MTLVEMQSALARLYVSAGFRSAFATEPGRALAEYQLTRAESDALQAVDRRALELFASTLVTKRMRRAQRAYSGSFAWHGPQLEALFRRFVEMHGAPQHPTVHHETVAFGRFAEQALLDPDRFARGTADLLRFERLAYEATFLHDPVEQDAAAGPATVGTRYAVAPGVQVGSFEVDVVALDSALRTVAASAGGDVVEAGDVVGSGAVEAPTSAGRTPAPEVTVQSSTIVFRPGRDPDGQRMLRLNGPPALVLGLCDGRRTAGEVVAQVEQRLGTAGLEGPVLDALGRLHAAGVLTARGTR